MAGVPVSAVCAEVATTTSAKTLVQVVAASNHRILVRRIHASFKGVVTTDAPILVEVLRQTTAGTSSALTPVKLNSSDDETLQTTAREAVTVEPTASDILLRREVHPQGGFDWVARFGEEIVVPGGARLGLRVTAGVSVSAVAGFEVEE